MDMEIKDDADVINVTVEGDIEIYSLGEFKNKLFEISQAAEKNIAIDLSKVDYIDTSGIGVLVSLYKLQEKKGKKLIITNVSADIQNLLKLTKVSDLFEM